MRRADLASPPWLPSTPSPSRWPTPPPPALLRHGLRPRPRTAAARLGRADDRLPRLHALADGLAAGGTPRAARRRARRGRHVAQAGREVAVGLRRRRAGARRDDLEGRDLQEEGLRPGDPRDRQARAAAGRADVAASKRFYVERGLAVARASAASTSSSSRAGAVTLGLYGRRALAKDAGVPRTAAARTGSSSAATRAVHRPGRLRVGARARRAVGRLSGSARFE